ncbi:MAG: hypothetical protein BZY88_09170 [SAR202 cluster bacterium Io17-Chloro-G9]|nr:MAG: hypothetical protein BZY88_09170 [SAR202 cluster bacterium Io17-Chloro-G9]
MNWIDLFVLIVCAVTVLYGFRVGLLRMVIPLVVVVAGLALSSRISGSVGNLFSSVSSDENTQTIMGFFAIFLVLFLASAIVSYLLRMVLGFIPFFGVANGLAGALVGLAIGFVLLSGIMTGVQMFPVGNISQTIEESRLGSVLADNFGVVMRGVRLIPVDWDAKVEDLKGALPENLPTSLPEGLPKSVPDLLPNISPLNQPGSNQ